MSSRSNKKTWTPEDINYLRETAGTYSYDELAAFYRVSPGSIRNVVLRNLSDEDATAIRMAGKIAQFDINLIVCPYFKRRLANGIQCDNYVNLVAKNRILAHCKNHCMRYWSQERAHCPMRKMLNFSWGINV